MKKVKYRHLPVYAGMAVLLAAVTAYGIRHGTPPGTGQTEGATAAEENGTGTSPTGAEAGRTQILLRQDGSEVEGTGASVSGNIVTISQGGAYSVSGTLEDGQIYVDTGSGEEVSLLFSGLDIRNASDAAVHIENAGHTAIVLEDGTKNRLQSGSSAEMDPVGDAEDGNASGAALYARDDLSITGTGSLEVYGYINNGIHTTNRLDIENGTISVVARNNGIKGKDSVSISDGVISVAAGGDGIQSDDTTGEGYGTVAISGGVFSIESESDAVQAETTLEISGGTFSVVSGGGSGNAAFPSEGGWGSPDSGWDMSDESETSTKGFKCGEEMRITGGDFTVDSRDDAFHSDGGIQISGGTFELASGDDGIHAGTELLVEDGSIRVTGSYEGLEGNQIRLGGGEISITASDDGINAYGGQSGWGSFGNSAGETPELCITGGNVSVNAGGDGIDSNGNLTIEGGVLVIDGPSDSRNGAIDPGPENGGTCTVNGGTVLALGSSGMAEGFDEGSGQYSFLYNFGTSFAAGDEITVTDSQGNELFCHVSAKEGNSVVFSCPELAGGGTYVLSAGSQSVEVTLDSISTTAGESGRGGWR